MAVNAAGCLVNQLAAHALTLEGDETEVLKHKFTYNKDENTSHCKDCLSLERYGNA